MKANRKEKEQMATKGTKNTKAMGVETRLFCALCVLCGYFSVRFIAVDCAIP